MVWGTAASVCPGQTTSGVITAGSCGESRSAQVPLHTCTCQSDRKILCSWKNYVLPVPENTLFCGDVLEVFWKFGDSNVQDPGLSLTCANDIITYWDGPSAHWKAVSSLKILFYKTSFLICSQNSTILSVLLKTETNAKMFHESLNKDDLCS